jgi:hypothetical protein
MAPPSVDPFCADCVKDPSLDVAHGRCQLIYDIMDECMIANKGNIGSCVKEWKAFRDCHESQKSAASKARNKPERDGEQPPATQVRTSRIRLDLLSPSSVKNNGKASEELSGQTTQPKSWKFW